MRDSVKVSVRQVLAASTCLTLTFTMSTFVGTLALGMIHNSVHKWCLFYF